jgi:Transposase
VEGNAGEVVCGQRKPTTTRRACGGVHGPVWAGVDTGKPHHHCVVIDHDSRRLLSRRVANDEQQLLGLLAAVAELAGPDQVSWAVDQADGGAALLIGLLVGHDQRLLYLPGRGVTAPPPATEARARPTPATRRSSPTRPGCAAT